MTSSASALLPPDPQATESEWATGNSNNSFTALYTKNLGTLTGRRELFGLRFNNSPPTSPAGATSPDYYRFTIASPVTLHATLNTWGVGHVSAGWPMIGVFTQAGAEQPLPLPLAASTTTSGPQGTYESLEVSLAPGSYAINVTGYHHDNEIYWHNGGPSYNWPYELTLDTSGPVVPTSSTIEQEWQSGPFNDLPSTAQALGPLPAFRTVHGLRYQSLRGGYSPDYYSFSVSVPTHVELDLNSWGAAYSGGGLRVARVGIFAASANPLFGPLFAGTTNYVDGKPYEKLVATLQPGNYVLGVTGEDHDDDDYWVTGGLSYDWPYEVRIEALPVSSTAVPATPTWAVAVAAGLLLLAGLKRRASPGAIQEAPLPGVP